MTPRRSWCTERFVALSKAAAAQLVSDTVLPVAEKTRFMRVFGVVKRFVFRFQGAFLLPVSWINR